MAIFWGREPDPEPDACHSCEAPITADNGSPVASTCGDCLTDCLCSDCREVRWQIGEDRAEQAAFDASREAS